MRQVSFDPLEKCEYHLSLRLLKLQGEQTPSQCHLQFFCIFEEGFCKWIFEAVLLVGLYAVELRDKVERKYMDRSN